MMSLPRWCHRCYAWFAGYFWLPCPVCGQMFGGHEWSGGWVFVLEDYQPKATCSRMGCQDATRIAQWIYKQQSLDWAIYWLSAEGLRRAPPAV